MEVIPMADDLQGMLECCICAEEFKDPRMLPCIHTFCLECLEKTGHDKQPGETMPCPLCRTEFKIPDEGLKSIAKNFFIEKLLNMHSLSVSSRCDACLDNSTDEEIPPAVVFCVECDQKLCDMCSQWHKKTKATKQHQLIDVNDKTAINQMARNFSASFCSKHETEVMEMYCWDCNMTLCLICYDKDHHQHKCLSARKVGEEFRTELLTSISKIPAIRSRFENEVSKNADRKQYILDKSSKMESEILEYAVNMKDIIDQHAKKLLLKIGLIKMSALKDLQNEKEELNRYRVMLESFKRYATELKERGSAVDICQNFQEIIARSNELERSDSYIFSKESDMGIPGCLMNFIPSELGTFLKIVKNSVSRLTIELEKQLEFETQPVKTTPPVVSEEHVTAESTPVDAASNTEFIPDTQMKILMPNKPQAASKLPEKTNCSYDFLFKILLLGDSSAGKTKLMCGMAESTDKFISTIANNVIILNLEIDGKRIKLELWDTANQERFHTITTSYYRGARGIMVVYDITNSVTFDSALKWLRNIQEHASTDVVTMLLGNKCDFNDKRQVLKEQGQEIADEHQLLFFEVSSIYNTNVKEALHELVRTILKRTPDEDSQQMKLELNEKGSSKSGCKSQ